MVKTKILLVRPLEPRPAKSGSVLHPLGLAYVGSMLERDNRKVEIFDCHVYQHDHGIPQTEEALKEKIARERPNIVGLTCKTTFFPGAVQIANIVKEIIPECITVVGGPHVTALPVETLSKNPSIDVAVVGEGEHTMAELCDALQNGRDLKNIEGIIFRENGKIVKNDPRPLPDKLDEIPLPAYHLLPMNKYFLSTARKNPFGSIMASRGCPNRCKFCSSRQIHGIKVRRRSVNNVVEEIMHLREKYNIKDFAFMDDTFTLNPKWVIEFCNTLIREKIDIDWQCQTRVNTVNREMLNKMKRSGCYMINYGVEFGSQRILGLSGKGITLPQIKRAFKLTKEIGIRIYAYFMMGYPGEIKEDIMQTISVAKELNPDFAQFSIVVPFPGSPLYDECVDNGYIDVINWEEFDYAYNPVIKTGELTPEELKELYKKAYREFYLRPTFVLRKLLNLRSMDEFKDTIIGGLSFLKFLTTYKS